MPTFDLRCLFLPYCLEKQPNGSYVALNRNYKPVGFTTREYATYADYPVSISLHITKTTAKKLSHNGDDNVDRIFLYNDGCVPTHTTANMSVYLERLAIFASIQPTQKWCKSHS